MKRNKDPRINTSYMSIKEYFLLFAMLAAFNGFHIWILKTFENLGMLETNIQLVINILMAYVLVTAACLTGLTAFLRHISWNRPMWKLGEAASKIAKGDFSYRISPLRKDGKKDYVEVMFDDFNTMAQELQSIETLKDDFIANVSHEIKTPLAIIQGYATALQEELKAYDHNNYISTIVEASGKISAMVSNILKLNKLENQEILSEAHHFNLGEQLRRCVLAFDDLCEQKNILLVSDIEDITVCYDDNMLEIVWNNLLSNAIKFTNPGGSISISLKAKDGYTQVSVNDSGCGMDDYTQKHIFDKFFQGDISRAQEGNGLGLALVKRAIDLLGGTVTVESKPGEGSTFTVYLKS